MSIKDEDWSFVAMSIEELKKQGETLDQAHEGLLIAPESPLSDPFWRVHDLAVRALSKLINDDFGCLSWFIYENEYGATALEAGPVGELKPIKALDDLRWLIEVNAE